MSGQPINLIPADVLVQREARRWRGRWALGLVVAAVGIGGATGALRLGIGNRTDGLRAELGRLESQLQELNAAEPGLIARVGTARRTAGAATVLADRPDWSELLAMLDRVRGSEVALDEVVVRGVDAAGRPAPAGGAVAIRVQVKGIARSQGGVQAFVLAVERSGVFDAVSPLGTRPATGVEGVAFEVECVLGSVRTAGVTP